MTADFVSFVAGCWLLIVCIMVMWQYYPSRWRALIPPEMLGLGIFLGFLGSGANTFWWQILNTINLAEGWIDPERFTEIGRWLDAVFKGTVAIAGMIHLTAKNRIQNDGS